MKTILIRKITQLFITQNGLKTNELDNQKRSKNQMSLV